MIGNKNRAGLNGDVVSISNDKNEAGRPGVSVATLPLAPTLVPVLGIQGNSDASALSDARTVDSGAEILRKALEAIPAGSTVAFAADDLGVLISARAPIVRDTEAYRKVEHLAQECNCSISFEEETGTIAFDRSEDRQSWDGRDFPVAP